MFMGAMEMALIVEKDYMYIYCEYFACCTLPKMFMQHIV